MKRAAAIAVAVVATLGIAQPAHAYVRSRTGSGTAIAFDSACVFIQPDTRGSEDVAFTDVVTVIQQCMTNWSTVASCSYLQLKYTEPKEIDAVYDGINTVRFRDDKWCHPATKHALERCYEPEAAAITTVFYLDRLHQAHDGVIVDADIEVNEVNFTFALLPSDKQPRANTTIADLENTLTHEMGHVMGLDHTCADSSTAANAVDETGHKPTACSAVSTLSTDERIKITEATMYNSAGPNETKKRSPEADDIAGVCEAYPLSEKQPSRCAPVDLHRYTTGCSMAATGDPAAAVVMLAFILSAIAIARRHVTRYSKSRIT